MKRNLKGFTLVEIMVVVAIIALLAAIAVPSFLQSRTMARRSSCINNMRLMDHAKEQWATTYSKNTGDAVGSTDIQAYMKNSVMPSCPAGGTYTIGVIGTLPSCTKTASPDLHVLSY